MTWSTKRESPTFSRWLSSLLCIVALAAFSTEAYAQQGDCCQLTLGVDGCAVPACEACVCAEHPSCCGGGGGWGPWGGWEHICVETAEAQCGADCSCTTTCGDGLCGGVEDCVTCAEDCGACLNDCCMGAGNIPGCNDLDCQECVCEIDELCCSFWGWSGDSCPLLALDECSSVCDCAQLCGDGECQPYETCVSCAADCDACVGSCCHENTSVTSGCDNEVCQDCVCALRTDCCATPLPPYRGWGLPCVESAQGREWADPDCSDVCGCGSCGDGVCQVFESCESCPDDCPPCDDDCCRVQDDAGCRSSACEACVCEADIFSGSCCTDVWGDICATQAHDSMCAEVCACDSGSEADCCAPHDGLGCGQLECERCVCSRDVGCCYGQWNEHCAGLARAECSRVCPGCAICGDGVCARSEHVCDCPEDCVGECNSSAPEGEGSDGCGGCATAPASGFRPWHLFVVLVLILAHRRRH